MYDPRMVQILEKEITRKIGKWPEKEVQMLRQVIAWKVYGSAAYSLLLEGHVQMARELLAEGEMYMYGRFER